MLLGAVLVGALAATSAGSVTMVVSLGVMLLVSLTVTPHPVGCAHAHLATPGAGLPVFLGLVGLSLGVAYLTMRQTRAALVVPTPETDSPQAQVAQTMSRVMPMMSFGSVLAVAVLPLGTVIYLVTSALWTLGERYAVRRLVTV